MLFFILANARKELIGIDNACKCWTIALDLGSDEASKMIEKNCHSCKK
tara:strand:- start:62 stop:205 length:144 start_codon:yes stop_codon:yes gene_type:complete